ncbi:hypothetical protein [Coleofasciculus sp. FACHB-SPT9]|nr:hypothetical protein [Coleofasciculus sp. FACHB-SPT9]MBD1887952.1 hypothetical protein [Coleofasciculus sp. FACHB-SPT9]
MKYAIAKALTCQFALAIGGVLLAPGFHPGSSGVPLDRITKGMHQGEMA